MMKQVKKMQEQMVKAQEELENKTVEGSAGGGVVTVNMNGHKKVLSITIQPEAVDPDDVEMLQDLVTAAVNDALAKADELVSQDFGTIYRRPEFAGLVLSVEQSKKKRNRTRLSTGGFLSDIRQQRSMDGCTIRNRSRN